MFSDREAAGKELANKMASYNLKNPLFLGIPRGGVVLARILWEIFGGDLDVYITRKIGAPNQPELAVGAVSPDGSYSLNEDLINRLNISENYLKKKTEEEYSEIKRRMQVYRGNIKYPDPEGRQVVVVDDGVATGATLMAALKGLREKRPAELILAVPVGPPDTLRKLENEVDKLFFVEAPRYFSAVGQFYLDFSQVEDDEVIAILEKIRGNNNTDLQE